MSKRAVAHEAASFLPTYVKKGRAFCETADLAIVCLEMAADPFVSCHNIKGLPTLAEEQQLQLPSPAWPGLELHTTAHCCKLDLNTQTIPEPVMCCSRLPSYLQLPASRGSLSAALYQ